MPFGTNPVGKIPRVFISELRLQDLSTHAQNILAKYTKDIKQDPIDDIDLDSAKVVSFLHRPLWDVPTWDDYQKLGAGAEYGAWVLYNRYYLNHYTISVHALPEPYNNLNEFNSFLKSIGIKLNNAGGEIKTSGDKLLRQSSSVAQMVESVFANGAYHAIQEAMWSLPSDPFFLNIRCFPKIKSPLPIDVMALK